MPPQRKNGAQKKVVDKSGLGRAIINRKARQAQAQADPLNHTTELAGGLHSVTQEDDLAEFLNTAALADTSFEAEKQNVKVISSPSASAAQHNPFLLTAEEERELREKHIHNQQRLRVPRRPAWDKDMKVAELERRERDSFLDWRRGLAELSDKQSLLLTPFERNIEVWRQLWRTIERSDLIVQIVDARNPLAFRCVDLEHYVQELSASTSGAVELPPHAQRAKRNLLLINKSDLLTSAQRRSWSEFFRAHDIQYAFFSAANAAALQAQRALALAGESPPDDSDSSDVEDDVEDSIDDDADEGESAEEEEDEATRILSVLELEDLFMRTAPAQPDRDEDRADAPTLTVGLVGYPNVGKSSTINALVGEKKVSVSATPGKTKHFQTIRLSPDVLLCDCPGLVFPQFAATTADLTVDGVLPIDQMREYTAPSSLVARRIPKDIIEMVYGLTISTLPKEEGGTGVPTSSELLSTYAVARGFFTSGQGNPDESRAARFVLKDYVSGKLLYCQPPPGVDTDEYNAEARRLQRARLQAKARKKAPVTRVPASSTTFVPQNSAAPGDAQKQRQQSHRARMFDQGFFGATSGVVTRSINPMTRDGAELAQGKKHFKGRSRKQKTPAEPYTF